NYCADGSARGGPQSQGFQNQRYIARRAESQRLANRRYGQRPAAETPLMKGLFITFEGSEGSGKSTQVSLLAEHLRHLGFALRTLREPCGTPIGEEIRHTLKHSADNEAMTWETELLLMNASRAQLVREVIRPALARNEIVISDRF